MDRLWKGPAFQAHQFSDFHFANEFDKEKAVLSGAQSVPSSVSDDSGESPIWPPASVVQYTPDKKRPGRGYRRTEHSREVDGMDDWAMALDRVPNVQDGSNRPSVSIIMFPRCPPLPDRELPNAQVLMTLPVDRPTFEDIVSKFHIHQALQIILFRGAPVIHRTTYTVTQPDGSSLPCRSYILRISISAQPDLALSLTHFPTANRIYAVFFGCSSDYADPFSDFNRLHAALEFAGPIAACQPFTLLNAFLDIEKRRRFAAVEDFSLRMADFAENWGTLTGDSAAAVRTYREVVRLREELEVWRGEVERLRVESVGDFATEVDGVRLLEAGWYLERLRRVYEEKGRVCEGVLQTAGFAFQAEATAMAREDTRTMKAIAVLTMLFLPATFVCTFLAMGVFDWHAGTGKGDKDGGGEDSNGILAPLWWIFFPMSGGLTAVVWCVFVLHGTGKAPFRRKERPLRSHV